MKAIVNWVMKGRMQAVIAATVLAMLGLLVTPLALLSAAVIVLTVLRQGAREGALVVAFSLMAITGLGGLVLQMPIATLVVGVLLWLPAAVLGAVMGRTGSLRLAIEAAAVGAALIVLLQYLWLADPAQFWGDALREFLSQRVEPETLQAANVSALIELMAGWMAGGVAASWLLLLVPVLLVVGVLLTGGEPSLVGQLYLIGMVVFLVQGISLAHGLVAEFGGSTAWLVGMYLLLIFVAPQGATMIAAAGYADGWLNFRARARARRSGSDGK